MDRTPPHNLAAEQAVLGSVMISKTALGQAQGLVSDDDWYRPAHETLWKTVRKIADRGDAVDPLTVAAQLRADGLLKQMPLTYLHTLVSTVATPGNVAYYANQVAEAATMRRLIEAHEKGLQRAYAAANGESDRTVNDMLEATRLELDLVYRAHVGDGAIPGLREWHEFFAAFAGQPSNWVIPGLIGAKDVWMVLAPPGAGKSTLSRQLAWCLAAGVHPFRPEQPIAAKNSLLVDLENDEGQMADDSVSHFGRIDSIGEGTAGRGFVWTRPQGINLSNPDDVALFDEVLRRTNPDLVTLGSLTNSAPRKSDWDQFASGIRDALNKLRTKHSFALWLEHHMPKAGEGGRRSTPFGSQIFESWPSHGRVLTRTADNRASPYSFDSPFRGDRGERETPVGFTRGGKFPWSAIWDTGELEVLTEACK